MDSKSINHKQIAAVGEQDFHRGLQKGLPIALGYLPVSFTFGLMAVKGGIPAWLTIFISLSNLTSAGQFAGASLIIAQASLLEIALTTLIINSRYLLMSLGLSQKLDSKVSTRAKSLLAFGVTDETFTVASLEPGSISFAFMLGLITGPYFGWALGTVLGALASAVLSPAVQSAMGIALYAMFIALVVPGAKKSRPVCLVAILAISISCLFTWLPSLSKLLSAGWQIMLATIVAASFGARYFPPQEELE